MICLHIVKYLDILVYYMRVLSNIIRPGVYVLPTLAAHRVAVALVL